MSDAGEIFDLAVIGAGINGAGIARDAAMRGLDVVLIDKGDIGSGTSWISSRLIHGGLRYLEYGEIPLVYESLRERKNLRRIAAHLVAPLRITIPVYASGKRPRWMIRLGMIAYDLLSWNKALSRHEMLSRDALVDATPGLAADGLRGGARYYDAQVTYAERLVLENVISAAAQGARVLTYSEVVGFEQRAGHITGVVIRDTRSGNERSLAASAVVNAAGPWVDHVIDNAAPGAERLIGGTKGSHIVLRPFDGPGNEAFYVEAARDGRPIFILPWNGLYLVGTTDIRYHGSLDDVRASRAEIEYLLDETNRVFPRAALTIDDVCYAYAGVRPLPYREDGPESAITRRHLIVENDGIADNLISVVGGKLTTYRHLAEEAVDAVGRVLDRSLPACPTAREVLPGADGIDEAAAAVKRITSLSAAGQARLLNIYGARARVIAGLADNEPTLAHDIDGDRRVCAAEIASVARSEFPRTLADIVFRRTMLGLEADQARSLYGPIAEIAAAEHGWDAATVEDEVRKTLRYGESLGPRAAE